jgi:hypothetical protein
MKLCDFFSFVELQCRYHHIPCCAFVDTWDSFFQRLYISHHYYQAMITFTSLDVISFQYLLAKFEPLYFQYSPYSVNGKIVKMMDNVVTKGHSVRLIVLVWFLGTPGPQDPYMLFRWCLELLILSYVFF